MSFNSKICRMTTDYLISELKQTTLELLDVLAAFSDDQINSVPFEGSWTGGQVADHLIKAERGLPQVLTNNTKSIQRPEDQHIDLIESIFLNFDTKLKAPDFIVPSEGPHDRETCIRLLCDIRENLISLAGSLDLSQTCGAAAFPKIGELTRLEWLYFVVCHSKRHTRQLRNILKNINK